MVSEQRTQRRQVDQKVNKQVITDQYALYNGDCCELIKGVASETVGFSIFSPPFFMSISTPIPMIDAT